MRRRPYALLVPAAVMLLALSACTSDGSSSTTSPSVSPTSTSTPATSATPTATPTASVAPGTPITLSCDQLLTSQDLYDFNPNFGVAPGYSPKAGSAEAAAVADGGIACGWSNQTSGDVIELAVSQPSPAHVTELRTRAAASLTAVPTFGTPPAVDGFFLEEDGAGSLAVFTEKYALVGSSVAFFEPGDAAKLVQTALSHLS